MHDDDDDDENTQHTLKQPAQQQKQEHNAHNTHKKHVFAQCTQTNHLLRYLFFIIISLASSISHRWRHFLGECNNNNNKPKHIGLLQISH